MITREALEQYRQFEKDLADTCKHICELFIRYNKRYQGHWEEFEIFDEECYKDKFVECTYYTFCMCERDVVSVTFPLEMLFMTDEEINKWIDECLEEERKKAEEEQRKRELKAQRNAERKHERDLAEYERIKKEYNL